MKNGTKLYIGHVCVLIVILLSFPLVEFLSTYFSEPVKDTHSVLAVITPTPDSDTDIFQEINAATPLPDPEEPLEAELYVEMVNGCGAYWSGVCAGVFNAPSATSTPVTYVRNGMSLKVEKKVIDEVGNGWYKIEFDEWLRYPQRIYTDWYIQEKYAREFYDVGMRELTPAQLKKAPAPTKHIIVDKSEQKLYAYDGDILFMETIVSTGTVLNPTPVGEFILFRKTPTRYMQGPLPGIPDDIYDLPGVPWVLYFTKEGAAIHGTYWHNNFGNRTSHGCVNVPITQAGILYAWANLNTSITIQE